MTSATLIETELLANGAAEVRRDANGIRFQLTRPPSNALNMEAFQALDCALEALETTDAPMLVVTGAEAVFSKGFDLELMHSCASRVELRSNLVMTNAVFSRLARARKPTVAAINGACLGGGLELALCCHFRLCATRTRLGLPEVWHGMLPGLGGIHRLVRLVGRAKALEMIALGDLVSAEDALGMGLVTRVFPKKSFGGEVASFLRTLGMVPTEVWCRLLHGVNQSIGGADEDNILDGLEAFRDLAPWMNGGGTV